MPIQSIARVSQILSLFSLERPRWKMTEIARVLGLPKTTVSSLLRTMIEEGLLEQDKDTRQYSLGKNLFALGIIASETLEINQKAQKPSYELSSITGLECRVAIWDRDAALVTLDIIPKEAVGLSRRIGPRVVAYCSSIGRALLAFFEEEELAEYLDKTELRAFTPYTIVSKKRLIDELRKTRLRRYAINNQELSIGRSSVAAPIFKGDGNAFAAISLTGAPERVLGEEAGSLVRYLLNAASDISRQMGYNHESPDYKKRSLI